MSDHVCDRKGPRAKVVDESGDAPITRIYPTCSLCGMPQIRLEHAVARAVGERRVLGRVCERVARRIEAHGVAVVGGEAVRARGQCLSGCAERARQTIADAVVGVVLGPISTGVRSPGAARPA